MRLLIAVAAACIASGAALSPEPASAQSKPEVSWKVQSLYQTTDEAFQMFSRYIENVKAMSKGRIEIVQLPVGAAVAPPGTLDAMRSGVLDGHFSFAALWSGIEPGFGLMADLSGGYDDEYQIMEYFYGFGGLPLLREMYAKYNIHTIGIASGGLESLPSRKPIRGVEDLKGMKVRVPPGITAAIFASLGASPVTLPLSEAFSALEKGVVDTADAGTVAFNDRIGLHQHAKYAVDPGFHSVTVVDFSVNAARWKAVPADLQRILTVAMPEVLRGMAYWRVESDAKVRAGARSRGLTFINWAPEERAKYRQAARKVWAEWAGRSEFAKRAVESQESYLKMIGTIKAQ